MSELITSPINSHYKIESFEDGFFAKDLVSVNQFTKAAQIKKIFAVAGNMEKIVLAKKTVKLLEQVTIAELFYQPSTRTFTSFLAAAEWLGCRRLIPIHGMNTYSSAVKGESLADTVRTIEKTTACDLIVLRHPDDNAAYEAAYYAKNPVVNAGSGKSEHPTQAVLDLYTIYGRWGKIKGLKVGMLGDLKYGRTVKSLAQLLTLVDNKAQLFFISPEVLSFPEDQVELLQKRGAKIQQVENLCEVLGELDVLYVTRIQKEWFKTAVQKKLYQRLKGKYDIDLKILKKAKKKMVLMHPLPRVGEILAEVDSDPRAAYFEQMRRGLYVRMALLTLILNTR